MLRVHEWGSTDTAPLSQLLGSPRLRCQLARQEKHCSTRKDSDLLMGETTSVSMMWYEQPGGPARSVTREDSPN